MKMIDSLIMEFEHETQTTRKHLERLPNNKLDWRPHEKSFTAGALASHIVDCLRWADSIFQPGRTRHRSRHLQALPGHVSGRLAQDLRRQCRQRQACPVRSFRCEPDAGWRFKMMGRLRFERPRAVVFRDFTLSHLIHHRGQFSVYLRLLNVPVPGSYGPTADEQP
jgi:uncharacterized damage-inducible protein DinB